MSIDLNQYTLDQQTIDDLLKLHGVDAIQEIERGIDMELKML